MKIVLVEDEPKSREGICKIIKNHTPHEVAAIAENGKQGIEALEKYNPDLMISDICMPEMSGLEMLEQIREKGYDTDVIFLTGYSEFEYAHQAIKLQAVDYILKPIEVEKFLEIIEQVESKQEQRKTEQISVEQMLWEYINGPEKFKSILLEKLEAKLGINDSVQVSLLYIYIGNMTTETVNEMIFDTKKCMESICMPDYYVIPFAQEQGILLLILDTEKNVFLKKILEARVVKKLLEITDFVCSYDTVYGIEKIEQTILNMRELLIYGFGLPKGKMIDADVKEKITFEKREYPISLETAIQKEIWKQDKEKIQKIGQQFIQEVIESKMHPTAIREYTIRFSIGILNANVEKGRRKEEQEEQYIISNMLECHTSRELEYQFEKILKYALLDFNQINITENNIILRVIAFIRENYNKDISLYEASQVCNVSAEYLSHLFKQETGVKFTAFLQNFRISMAKRMLLSEKTKIYEIAEAVGYHDQKYFVSVFKKLCGMTPSEYRKERGI